MSKQLTLSASLSLLAMLGFAVSALAEPFAPVRFGALQLGLVASACAPSAPGELLPLLQPGLQ